MQQYQWAPGFRRVMAEAVRGPGGVHRCVHMGQGATCENTPEGGTVCSDGTYHPPGCPTLPPVRASEARGGVSPVLLGLGGAVAVAAAAFFIFR